MTSCIDVIFCVPLCKKLSQKADNAIMWQRILSHTLTLSIFGLDLAGFLFACVHAVNICLKTIPALLIIYLLILTMTHYFYAVWLDPGRVPPEYRGVKRKCVACERFKPIRAHHCSTCQVCVIKFDHHCPWLANCIGINNYAHFWLFHMWAIITQLYVVAFCIVGMATIRPFPIITCIAACVAFIVSIGLFVLFRLHIILIITNQTTVEYFGNKTKKGIDPSFRNPYDLGSVGANFRQVFPQPYKIILPIRVHPAHNGLWTYDYDTGIELSCSPVTNPSQVPSVSSTVALKWEIGQPGQNSRTAIPPLQKYGGLNTSPAVPVATPNLVPRSANLGSIDAAQPRASRRTERMEQSRREAPQNRRLAQMRTVTQNRFYTSSPIEAVYSAQGNDRKVPMGSPARRMKTEDYAVQDGPSIRRNYNVFSKYESGASPSTQQQPRAWRGNVPEAIPPHSRFSPPHRKFAVPPDVYRDTPVRNITRKTALGRPPLRISSLRANSAHVHASAASADPFSIIDAGQRTSAVSPPELHRSIPRDYEIGTPRSVWSLRSGTPPLREGSVQSRHANSPTVSPRGRSSILLPFTADPVKGEHDVHGHGAAPPLQLPRMQGKRAAFSPPPNRNMMPLNPPNQKGRETLENAIDKALFNLNDVVEDK